jgi:hypothetical protein
MTPEALQISSVNSSLPFPINETSSSRSQTDYSSSPVSDELFDPLKNIYKLFGYSSVFSSIGFKYSTYSSSYVQTIMELVTVESRIDVIQFFQKNPTMIAGVGEIIKNLKRCFSENSHFILQKREDPESGDEYIRICTRLTHYPENFFDITFEIEESCSYLLAENRGKILITTDHLYPE